MKIIAFILVFIFIFSLCACTKPQHDTILPTPSPSASIVENEVDYEKLADDIKDMFHQKYVFTLSAYDLSHIATMVDLAASFDTFKEITSHINSVFEQTCYSVMDSFDYDGKVEFNLSPLTWQQTTAIWRTCASDTSYFLRSCCTFEVEIDKNRALINAGYSDSILFNSLVGEKAFSAKCIYSYLNTIYDDSGIEKDYTDPEYSQEYIDSLTLPLPGRRIKDGWYNPRSQSTRKHTGTDIKAPEGEHILSCTDGEVIHIGSNAGAGNYVVVLDEYGYEYHYYHMVELTTFVEVGDKVSKGDVIGLVGNTGNSDANHLHLTVITPEYTYVNPYPLLVLVTKNLEK